MKHEKNKKQNKKEDGPGTRLYNCISRIIITDQFTKQYMDVFRKYGEYIDAKLVQETA